MTATQTRDDVKTFTGDFAAFLRDVYPVFDAAEIPLEGIYTVAEQWATDSMRQIVDSGANPPLNGDVLKRHVLDVAAATAVWAVNEAMQRILGDIRPLEEASKN